jgi:hypothetical protein
MMKNRYKVKPYGRYRWQIWDTQQKKFLGGIGWGHRSEAERSCKGWNENYHARQGKEG